MNEYIFIIISFALLAFIIYRQVKIRPVQQKARIILPLILMIIGLADLKDQTWTFLSVLLFVLSLTVLAGGMGALRAGTVKLWADGGIVYRRGTWITIVLWVVSAGLHYAADAYAHLGTSTLVLYLGVTFLVQSFVVQYRAKRLFGAKTV
jgi:hypothetical protein